MSRPLYPPKDPVLLYKRLSGPQNRSGRVWKISVPLGFDTITCPIILSLLGTNILGTLSKNKTYRSSSSLICQTTGPKPLAKRFLHIVRSRASSSNSQYPLLSFRSSSNFLRLLPCLLVTSICPFIFPSITCFRSQFLHKM